MNKGKVKYKHWKKQTKKNSKSWSEVGERLREKKNGRGEWGAAAGISASKKERVCCQEDKEEKVRWKRNWKAVIKKEIIRERKVILPISEA